MVGIVPIKFWALDKLLSKTNTCWPVVDCGLSYAVEIDPLAFALSIIVWELSV